ncbi:hypothetical protein COTS27_01075 [Spirochaetota bacterium]|nr:hypothetical protein COTS27_01075 [Spirochaetota bacterium]
MNNNHSNTNKVAADKVAEELVERASLSGSEEINAANESTQEPTQESVPPSSSHAPSTEKLDDDNAVEEAVSHENGTNSGDDEALSLHDDEQSPSEQPILAENVKLLEEKITEYKTLVKRQQAEFDNYRKRTLDERQKLLKYAPEEFIQKLFPILSHYEKALTHQNSEADAKIKSFLDGFSIIKQQLDALLTEFNVRPSTQIGDTFDPNVHQAIMIETAEQVAAQAEDSRKNTPHASTSAEKTAPTPPISSENPSHFASDTNNTSNNTSSSSLDSKTKANSDSNAQTSHSNTSPHSNIDNDGSKSKLTASPPANPTNTADTISAIFEQGYFFHDRVIKIAHVKVMQAKKK